MKIFGGLRASLIGDSIMSLPLLNVLYKMYGHPLHLTMSLARKCKQAAPLFLFQEGIHEIKLTHEEEFLTDIEIQNAKDYHDIFINPTPGHSDPFWYNNRSCVEETMLQCGAEYHEVWKTLPKKLQQPRLNKWWDTDFVNKKFVAFHCKAGYGKGNFRSPSINWWNQLAKLLIQKGYTVIQVGHCTDEKIRYLDYIKYYNNYSLFEQIQIATGCEYYLGTDSGFSWIINSYGINKCISLITRWESNHIDNDLALAPENWNNKNINLFGQGNCDAILFSEVLAAIEKL